MTRWKMIAAVGAVAAVVIASAIVLLVFATGETPAPQPSPSAGAPLDDGPRIQPATPGATVPPGGEDRPSAGDQTSQVKVCNAYLDAFLIPGTPEERANRLKDLGTPANVEQAKLAARLPEAKRKGDCALDPSASRAAQAQAHVQLTDGSWWAMSLVKDLTVPAGWRVQALTREGH